MIAEPHSTRFFTRQTAGATPGALTFDYGYDRLNRLATFTLSGDGTTGGTYGYDMDEFGNITGQTATTGDPKLPAGVTMVVDESTNRLESIGSGPNPQPIAYDVLGNQVTQIGPEGQALGLDYLDQGHIRKVGNSAGVLYRYYYDADGKRRIKAQADGSGATSITDNCSYAFYEGEDYYRKH